MAFMEFNCVCFDFNYRGEAHLSVINRLVRVVKDDRRLKYLMNYTRVFHVKHAIR